MTCLSAGKKTDMLTAVDCLAVWEYYCWMLDVRVCRARLFIRRFGLLPQYQLFSTPHWSYSRLSPRDIAVIFSVALHERTVHVTVFSGALYALLCNIMSTQWRGCELITSWNHYMNCVIIICGLWKLQFNFAYYNTLTLFINEGSFSRHTEEMPFNKK